MLELGAMPLAVLAVKLFDRDPLDGPRLEAAHIDAITVRVGTRHVKRLDAANLAEHVPGETGVKGIRSCCESYSCTR